jgi:5-methylcytosine-specific restriction endonuclease McrA
MYWNWKHISKELIINAYYEGKISLKGLVAFLNYLKYGRLTCEICKYPIYRCAPKSLDHIIPKSAGGKTIWQNLQLTHPRCNIKKNNILTLRNRIKVFFRGII